MREIDQRVGETVYIGDDVAITLLEIKGDKLIFGISAPRRRPVICPDAPAANDTGPKDQGDVPDSS